MARGKTLVSLLTDFRVEARLSLNPAHNNQVRDSQIGLLQRVQETLWEDFNWPHLRVTRDLLLQAGQRYYDVPEDLDIDRVEKIEIRYGGRWLELVPEISSAHYDIYDSDTDVRATPVQRWRITEDEQVEIWPISDLDGDADTLEGTLRFTGIRKLNPLAADGDRADIDNRLLTLYAAAEELASSDAKRSQLKLAQANKLYAKLRGNLTPRKRFKMFGVGCDKKKALRGPPTVYYRTTT